MKIYSYKHPDSAILSESSSGGAMSALANQIFSEGGCVFGACFSREWKRVIFEEAQDCTELRKLRQSKYVYSSLGDSIKLAKNRLDEGKKVMFVALPCQIAAVKKLLGEHKNSGNLLTVQLICHGAPSGEIWAQYLPALCRKLGETIDNIEAISFRDKVSGWKGFSFSVHFKNGKTYQQHHSKEPYVAAFLRNLTLRDVCFNCAHKYPKVHADIILGDFWGVETIAPELDNNEGVSVILAATANGQDYAKKIGANTLQCSFTEINAKNPALSQSCTKPKGHIKKIGHNKNAYKVLRRATGKNYTSIIKSYIYPIYRTLRRFFNI